EAMQRLSGQYPRFGSRRIRVFLGREGLQVGQERCSRLWREAGLQTGASQAQAPPRSRLTASPMPAYWQEQRLELRLRIRCLRQRSDAEMFDSGRRVHAGMLGD